MRPGDSALKISRIIRRSSASAQKGITSVEGTVIMTRRFLACAALLLACLVTLAPLPAAAPPAESAFGATQLWAIHLDVTAKEYDAIQPSGGFGFGPPQ